MAYRIGHPSYSGRNAFAPAATHAAALRILLQRGVRMAAAQRALTQARAGSHACCSYCSRAPSGRLVPVDTIEVTFHA